MLLFAAQLPTRYGHVEFYSVAAQVMPILLLAIVFEQRLFRRRGIPPIVLSITSSLLIGLFLISEAVALRVLYVGYAHRQDQDLVIVPMLVAAFVLLVPVTVAPVLELERQHRGVQSTIAILFFSVVAVVVGTLLKVLFTT
jgi:hypothetical protein